MPFSVFDHAHMARALALAERGLFTTQPNPRVGCVIAHGDATNGVAVAVLDAGYDAGMPKVRLAVTDRGEE